MEAVELGILNQIPEKDLDHAAETLLALKNTLLEMIEADDARDILSLKDGDRVAF